MQSKLFNKDFTLLWLGQSVSQLGNGAGFIGLLWWIQTTTGSALALGTLAMVQTLIAIILGPIGGALVDRLNRKGIIVSTDAIRGGTNILLAYLATTGQLTLPMVFALAGVNAVCGQFFNPAIQAAIPMIVPKERLEQANSLNQVSVSITNLVSYAAGGVLVAFLGIPALLFINGASFLVSALSELFIHIPAIHSEAKKLTFRLFGTDLKEGFAYIVNNTALFKIMQAAMVLNFFSAPIWLLLPKLVDEHMGVGAEVYGYLLSAQMAGALLATLVMSSTGIVKNNLWLVRWGIVGLAGLVAGIVIAPGHLWGIHIGLFAGMGLINSVVNIYFSTVLQRVTRPEHMGKVFGFLMTVGHGLQPLSQGLSGVIAEFVRLPFIYLGCSVAIAGGGVQFGLVPGLTKFLRGESAEETAQAAPATA